MCVFQQDDSIFTLQQALPPQSGYIYNKGDFPLGWKVEELEGNWLVSPSPIFQSAKYSFARPCHSHPYHAMLPLGDCQVQEHKEGQCLCLSFAFDSYSCCQVSLWSHLISQMSWDCRVIQACMTKVAELKLEMSEGSPRSADSQAKMPLLSMPCKVSSVSASYTNMYFFKHDQSLLVYDFGRGMGDHE